MVVRSGGAGGQGRVFRQARPWRPARIASHLLARPDLGHLVPAIQRNASDAKMHRWRRCGRPLTIDENVLRLVKIRAARTGKADSAVIEESLRRDLGLSSSTSMWERNDLPEKKATALAVEAQHRTRQSRR